MCSRRVFANNIDLNSSEYISSIKGEQIYRNLRSKGSNIKDNNYTVVNNEISNFSDYNTFLNLSRAYFRHYGPNISIYQAPKSINEAKTSFIYNNQLLSNIKDCNYCNICKKNTIVCECKEDKNILYPYGNNCNKSYHLNDYSDTDFKFPVKLTFIDSENCSDNHNNCHNEHKKLVPICNEFSYGKKCCNSCDSGSNCGSRCGSNCGSNCGCGKIETKKGCMNKCVKKCTKTTDCNPCRKSCCENPCERPQKCLNNVYPSQHQFMYYKSGYGQCYINENFDQESRMKAYAIYPKIRQF